MKKAINFRMDNDTLNIIDTIVEQRIINRSYLISAVLEKFIFDSESDAKKARANIARIKHFDKVQVPTSKKIGATVEEELFSNFRALIAPMPHDMVINNLLYHLKDLSPEELDDYKL